MRLSTSIAAMITLIVSALPPARGQSVPPAGPAPAAPPVDVQHAIASGPTGSLAIRGVQGTKGGPEVGADEVEVVLFHQNQPFHQLKTALDEHGIVVVRDLPMAMAVRPVVRIKHGGVLYQEVGPPMGADKKDAAMEVTVYEVTDETPPWRVSMRHLAAERGPGGVVVSEMLVVDNPADRTWLGAAPDRQNRRATVKITLPKDAADIQLSAGFHGWCCTALEGGVLNIQMPLMPGRMSYRFAYRVPESAGRADLRIAAPVPTDQVVFMLPADGSTAEPTLVEPFSPPDAPMPGGRMFKAQAVSPDTAAGIVLASLPQPPAPALAEARGTAAHTKIIAGVIAGLVLLGGLIMIIRRQSAARA
ncbi:MAG: hypothetical protein IT436_04725 [Phycisphaerales bacterium]|nr:hypothetical protein [Phycisphaerales bacterium]